MLRIETYGMQADSQTAGLSRAPRRFAAFLKKAKL